MRERAEASYREVKDVDKKLRVKVSRLNRYLNTFLNTAEALEWLLLHIMAAGSWHDVTPGEVRKQHGERQILAVIVGDTLLSCAKGIRAYSQPSKSPAITEMSKK